MKNVTEIEELSLSISCVTFNTDPIVLAKTIESLVISIEFAKKRKKLGHVIIFLIDNGPDGKNLIELATIKHQYQHNFDTIKILTGQGNVGYGRGNNLAINETRYTYHLIINPDVIVAPDNIYCALKYLVENPDVGLVAPYAMNLDGSPHYIAKRYPSLSVLLTRALKLKLMQRWLRGKLYAYEYRDKIPASTPLEIELASGCYMLCRSSILKEIGGFSPKFFMYFEDFDLSIRIRTRSKIVHLPNAKIIHYGGDAAQKGFRHIVYFICSLIKFYM